MRMITKATMNYVIFVTLKKNEKRQTSSPSLKKPHTTNKV